MPYVGERKQFNFPVVLRMAFNTLHLSTVATVQCPSHYVQQERADLVVKMT